jgi:hypothetical protein
VTAAMMMMMTLIAVVAGLLLRRGVAFSSASVGHRTRVMGESTPLGVAMVRARIMERVVSRPKIPNFGM